MSINKFCFVAIVRDESHVIQRFLDSAKNIATSMVICDTGSNDNTVELIENFMKQNNIPGKVIKDTWVNYAVNRSNLMRYVYTDNESLDAKYIIWHDADEVFITDESNPLSYLTKQDADTLYEWLERQPQSITHITTKYGNSRYPRTNICKNNQLYEWHCPKHEFLLGTKSNTVVHYNKFVLLARQEGNASKDPQRCIRDSQMFLDHIELQGGIDKCPREVFYLAMEFESFDVERAIEYHKLKVDHVIRYDSERYISCLHLGRICTDSKEIVKYLKIGIETCSDRLECINELVKYYIRVGEYNKALSWAVRAPESRMIDVGALFSECNVYDYDFDMNYSLAAHFAGKNELADYINKKNLLRNQGTFVEKQMLINQRFIQKNACASGLNIYDIVPL